MEKVLNNPRPSLPLQIFQELEKRMVKLSKQQHDTYNRLHQGYLGEKKFALFLQNGLHNQYIPLYDIRLKVEGSECQIDSLPILQNDVHLLDIKNFQGDYYIENNQWFTAATKVEIKNPLHQLNRCELLLREFLSKSRSPLKVSSHLVFVNPSFYLYQAPVHLPIIFPGRINRYIHRLNNIPSHLGPIHQNTAKQLIANHLPESAYEEIPTYAYNELKKGITCRHCKGFMEKMGVRKLICELCNSEEAIRTTLLHNIEQFHLLFPNQKITVQAIYQWCDYKVSKSSIQRTLLKHFKLIKNGKSSHYLLQNI